MVFEMAYSVPMLSLLQRERYLFFGKSSPSSRRTILIPATYYSKHSSKAYLTENLIMFVVIITTILVINERPIKMPSNSVKFSVTGFEWNRAYGLPDPAKPPTP